MGPHPNPNSPECVEADEQQQRPAGQPRVVVDQQARLVQVRVRVRVRVTVTVTVTVRVGVGVSE